MKYIVKIKRDSTYSSYEVDLDENLNVLDVVEYIKNYIDPTLTFRSFCKSAICGSCAMVVGGSSKLACKIKAVDYLEDGVLVIEPLKHFEVIKDLVVEQDKGFNKLKKVTPLIPKTPPETEFLIPPKEAQSYDKLTDCILCMACYSDCGALDNNPNYLGPFAFSKELRFINDSRDSFDNRIKEAVDGDVFDCIECQACILACPKGLTPQFDIKTLQSKALANGYTNPHTQDFGSFTDFGGLNGFF